MRKPWFVLVLLTISTTLAAQPDNWYFSLSMGGCWPIGSFANSNPDLEEHGFARKGFALNLDATYPFNEHWGLKGVVMLNSNPTDRNGMGTMMEQRMVDQVPFTETERDNLTLSVNSWMSNSMLFGPVYSFNFDRFAWDFHLMTGMNVAYLPSQKLLYEHSSKTWEYLQRNTNSVNISLDLLAGTAFRFKVSEKTQLKLAFDYQQSKSKTSYEELKTTILNGNKETVKLNSGNVYVPKQVVMASIGFVYYL
jgi:hypothetical protein